MALTSLSCLTCEQILTNGRCTNGLCPSYVEVMDAEHEDCRERIAALEGENTRLKGIIDLTLAQLDQPGSYHTYVGDTHSSYCGGCQLRDWLRRELNRHALPFAPRSPKPALDTPPT